jgi:hypothetical protein
MKYILILTKILQKYGVKEAAIFGSVARGEAKKGSDLDLLITMPSGMGYLKYGGMKIELEEELGVKVDLTEKNHIKPILKPYVMQDLVQLSL